MSFKLLGQSLLQLTGPRLHVYAVVKINQGETNACGESAAVLASPLNASHERIHPLPLILKAMSCPFQTNLFYCSKFKKKKHPSSICIFTCLCRLSALQHSLRFISDYKVKIIPFRS